MKRKKNVEEQQQIPVGVSLSEAADAAGIDSEKRVRHWLDRRQITLDANEKDYGKHRRFTFLDVVKLATIAKLLRFGMTVERADRLVSQVISADTLKNPAPAALIVRSWKQNKLEVRVAYSEKTGEFKHHVRIHDEDVPPGHDDIYLTVNLAKIAETVLNNYWSKRSQ
jgi:hypothetical protein